MLPHVRHLWHAIPVQPEVPTAGTRGPEARRRRRRQVLQVLVVQQAQAPHVCRTIQLKHADIVAGAIMNRCKDLKFKKDFSQGKWYDDKSLLVWNTAVDSVAFVALHVGKMPFKEKLEVIFFTDVRNGAVESHVAKIVWADFQPDLIIHCSNAEIETRIDTVCEMVQKFGFDMSMAKIDEPETDLGDSPAQDANA
jgi:hypothetical protein|eukprot:4655650-Prymnesium_polylepis.2